jgi:hypothetical protein
MRPPEIHALPPAARALKKGTASARQIRVSNAKHTKTHNEKALKAPLFAVLAGAGQITHCYGLVSVRW